MNIKDAEASIKKYMRDMESRKADAIKLIESDSIGSAMLALRDVSQLEAIIAEYEFIIDLIKTGE